MNKRIFIIFTCVASIIFGVSMGIYLAQDAPTAYKSPLPSLFVSEPKQDITPSPGPSTLSQISPDGTHILTVVITPAGNNLRTYTIQSSQQNGDEKKTLITLSYPSEDTLKIPFNTWSPNNVYVFVTHISPAGEESILLSANGSDLRPETKTINITQEFQNKFPSEQYKETTGWASNTLLIINTTDDTGKTSHSYWYEVPRGAMIPLSSTF